MTEQEMKEACIEKIENAYLMFMDKYGVAYNLPRIIFDLKGDTAGITIYNSNIIRLNLDILKHNTESFINRTPVHEAAHLLAVHKYGLEMGRGHGRAWKRTMMDLGMVPDRCHSYDVSEVKKGKSHFYKCGCQTHVIGNVRHRNILRENKTFYCRKCKQNLEYDRPNV